MDSICAWCGKSLSGKEPLTGLVSHGICKECLGRELYDFNQSLKSFTHEHVDPVRLAALEQQPGSDQPPIGRNRA